MKFHKVNSTPESRWFFTSDLHLNHSNILKFSDRPFKSIEDMNQGLIENINSLVRKNDVLVVAGDFCWDRPQRHFDRINCENIHFVLGSHDKHIKPGVHPKVKSVQDVLYIDLDGQAIVVSHCPYLRWEKSHYGSWNLFGHLHTRVHPINLPETPPFEQPPTVWSRIVDLLKGEPKTSVQPQDTDFNRIIRTSKMIDVGVDGHQYRPWSFEDLAEVMKYKPGYLLHHGKRTSGCTSEKEVD